MGETERIIGQPRKIFLSFLDAETGGLSNPIVVGETSQVTLGPFVAEETETGHRFNSTIRMTATIRPLSRKIVIRLLQTAGIIRAPRCAYKTNIDFINRRRYNGHRRPKKR